MANLFDFLQAYGDQPFEQRPLTVVDAAILAQLAYCTLVGSGRLADIDEAAMADTWQEANNRKLLQTLAASRRYRTVRWLHPVSHQDAERQQEFSAVCWQLTADTYYLAFRGTRASFVDWKEDFNMTYLAAIPAQTAASAYLAGVMAKHAGHFYLGGHSKGGSLATYAFAHATHPERILQVFSFDGPGLKTPLPANPKVLKMVPQSSLVGVILDASQDFAVVHSTALGFRQHDLFTWEVRDGDFVYLPATDKRSQYAQKLLADWLAGLDDATKQQALDALYAVVAGTDQETFAALAKTPAQSAKAILAGLGQTQASDRAAWRSVAASLAKAALAAAKR